MQGKHKYTVGDLLLAKNENKELWPCRVISCLRNETYRVVFFCGKGEASVKQHDVMCFTAKNVEKLRKDKETSNNQQLMEALQLVQKVIYERIIGNHQFEEEVLTLKPAQSPKKAYKNSQNSLKKEKKIEQQVQTSVPSHLQLKYLLNQFIKHCSHSESQEQSNPFTQYDAQRLAFLLSPQADIGLDDILDQFVLERLILTMQVIDQWGAPGFESLAILLKQKYLEFSQAILSSEFQQSSRRVKAIKRIQQYGSNLAME